MIKGMELAEFCYTLNVLLTGGIPIVTALDILKPDFPELEESKRRITDEGIGFGESLENIIPYDIAHTIAVAEKSGNVEQILQSLSEELKRNESLISGIKIAMVKPFVAIVVALGVSIYFPAFLVPKFRTLFGTEKLEFNIFTRIVFSISDAVSGHVWLGLLIIIGIPTALWFILTERRLGLMNNVPILGEIFSAEERLKMFSLLSNLINAGLSPIKVLTEMNSLYPEYGFDESITKIRNEGSSFGEAISYVKLVPSYAVRLITATEVAGGLAKGLQAAIDITALKLTTAIKKLDPALAISTAMVMGLVVIAVFVGVFLPVYQSGANLY